MQAKSTVLTRAGTDYLLYCKNTSCFAVLYKLPVNNKTECQICIEQACITLRGQGNVTKLKDNLLNIMSSNTCAAT
jgi:hypothetical protein